MRDWAGPLATLGGVLSLAFWIAVPLTTRNTYLPGGADGLYIALALLSVAALVGALLAKASPVFAAALMGVGAFAGVGALLLPGLLLIIAALVTLDAGKEASRPPVSRTLG